VEKQGLIVLPQRNLAMYTCKTVPNVGPQGAQGIQGIAGIDTNSWYDTVLTSCSDRFTEIAPGVGSVQDFRAPYPLDLTTGYIRMSVSQAPVGSSIIVDVLMNGVTILGTLLSIDAGEETSVTAATPAVLSTFAVPDDARFDILIVQVGATFAGIGLKLAVTGIKTD